jgi:CRP/FNR family transcriptional regulator, anaerobic regulatory protein
MFDADCSFPSASVSERSSRNVAGGCGERREEDVCLNCPGRAFGLCAGLDDQTRHELFQISSRLSVASGRELARQGESSRHILTITAGGLALSRVCADGRRFVSGFAWPGDLVGLVAEETSSFSAVATGPTEVCRQPRAVVLTMAKNSPRLAESMFTQMQSQLAAAQDHMVALGCGTALERVAQFLARLQERRGRTGKMSPRVELPMRRFDVAAHLGLSVETVSRTFQALVRKETIMVIPDGVRILSRDRLLEIARGVLGFAGKGTDRARSVRGPVENAGMTRPSLSGGSRP